MPYAERVKREQKEEEYRAERSLSFFRGGSRGQWTRKQYASWLKEYRWDYFMTATFRSPRRDPQPALKHVHQELRKHNVARAFMVVEPHQSGDLHIHGILAGTKLECKGYFGVENNNMDTPTGIWDGLFKRFGRAKVEPCNNHEAISMYCSKYLLKQQSRACDYYEVYGNRLTWENGKI